MSNTRWNDWLTWAILVTLVFVTLASLASLMNSVIDIAHRFGWMDRP